MKESVAGITRNPQSQIDEVQRQAEAILSGRPQ
jgi:hypothetical protein